MDRTLTLTLHSPSPRPPLALTLATGGQTLFSACTWAGYVGVLTGVRGGGYSVSVNYRRTEAGNNSMARGLVGAHWPVSFLVRNDCDHYHK